MESRYYIGYDLNKGTTNIKFKQGNVDTAVLEVALFDNGLKADISGETIEFRFLKPDGTVVFQDSTSGVTIKDAQNGKVECVLKSETLSVPGNVKCEIHRSKNGKILNMPTFIFVVESSIGEGKISENYIGRIENYITEYEQLNNSVKTYDNKINNFESQLADITNIVLSIERFPIQAPEANDTGRIQRAIDSLEGKGGIIFFKAKTYCISQVKLPSYVTLQGVGKTTIFKAISNNDKPMFVLKANTSQYVGLRDMFIWGDKGNQTSALARGIEFINTRDALLMKNASQLAEHDARHVIDNVVIFETKGDGFYIEGRGETQIHMLQTLRCDGIGIYANSADTTYVDCDCGDSGLEGFYQGTMGTNNRLVNCKSWFSGRINRSRGDGFSFNGDRLTLTALESQDNSRHGFVFVGKDIVGSSLAAEANGWQYATGIQTVDGTGFLFYGCQNCNIQGVSADRFSTSTEGSHQTYGMQFLNLAKNNFINLSCKNMKISAFIQSQINTDNIFVLSELTNAGVSTQSTNFNTVNANTVTATTVGADTISLKNNILGSNTSTLTDLSAYGTNKLRFNRYASGDIEFLFGTATPVFTAKSVGDFVFTNTGKGIIVKSPDGLITKRIGIDNTGALSITTV